MYNDRGSYGYMEPPDDPDGRPPSPGNILPNGIFSRYGHYNQSPSKVSQPSRNRFSTPQFDMPDSMRMPPPPPGYMPSGDPYINYPAYLYSNEPQPPTITLRGRPRTVSSYVADPVDNVKYMPTPPPVTSAIPLFETQHFVTYCNPQMVPNEYTPSADIYYMNPNVAPGGPRNRPVNRRRSAPYYNRRDEAVLNLTRPKKSAAPKKMKAPQQSKKVKKLTPSEIPPSEEAVDAFDYCKFQNVNIFNMSLMLPSLPCPKKDVYLAGRMLNCCNVGDKEVAKKLYNFLSNGLNIVMRTALVEAAKQAVLLRADMRKCPTQINHLNAIDRQIQRLYPFFMGDDNYDSNAFASHIFLKQLDFPIKESSEMANQSDAPKFNPEEVTPESNASVNNSAESNNNIFHKNTADKQSDSPGSDNASRPGADDTIVEEMPKKELTWLNSIKQNYTPQNNMLYTENYSPDDPALVRRRIDQILSKELTLVNPVTDKVKSENVEPDLPRVDDVAPKNKKQRTLKRKLDAKNKTKDGTAKKEADEVKQPQDKEKICNVANVGTIYGTLGKMKYKVNVEGRIAIPVALQISETDNSPILGSSSRGVDFELFERRVQAFNCKYCVVLFDNHKRFMVHIKWHEKQDDSKTSNSGKRNEESPRPPPEDPSANPQPDNGSDQEPSSGRQSKRMRKSLEKTCDMCNNVFPNWRAMMEHKRLTHDATNVYNCDTCQKSFKFARSLQKHLDTHLEKTHPCPKCNKKFGSVLLLSIHSKIHEGKVKKFQCAYCPKAYYDSHAVGAHERTHTNERPFSCEICFTTFGTTSGLKRHMKVSHSASKPFECPVCHRSFSTLNIRDRHQVRFHGAPELLRFACEVCPSRFMSERDLRKHTRTVHSTNRRRRN